MNRTKSTLTRMAGGRSQRQILLAQQLDSRPGLSDHHIYTLSPFGAGHRTQVASQAVVKCAMSRQLNEQR
jgi:hypothetical protein